MTPLNGTAIIALEGDARMPTVLTDDGVRLSYRLQGHGATTLVFLHGWAGSGAYFDDVVAELDLTGLRVVTMDLRGHGESETTVAPYDVDRLVSDVWTVADAADARHVVLVGFSMSGKFAQYAALRAPDRVSGLVLVGGFPASPIPFPLDLLHDWVGRAGDRDRIREMLVPFITQPVEAAVLNRFLDDAITVSAPVLECTLKTCITLSFAERVHDLDSPVLIVGGTDDVFFPPEVASQMARALPCARAVTLPCNHEIPIERPRDLAHLIDAFVCGLGAGQRALAGSQGS